MREVQVIGPEHGRIVVDVRVADSSELAEVRHQAADACVEDLAAVGDDLVLCVSELLTNALVHGDGPVRVVVTRSARAISVAVHDRARRTPHLVLSSSHVGGRGLRIVDALSDRWGMEFGAEGKTVWATVRAT